MAAAWLDVQSARLLMPSCEFTESSCGPSLFHCLALRELGLKMLIGRANDQLAALLGRQSECLSRRRASKTAAKSLAAGLFAEAVRHLAPVLSVDRADRCLLMAQAKSRSGRSSRRPDECLGQHVVVPVLSASDASRWHRMPADTCYQERGGPSARALLPSASVFESPSPPISSSCA